MSQTTDYSGIFAATRLSNERTKLRVLVAMGTRPEIIKLAPVVHECRRQKDWQTLVLHSGQHLDLAQPMIDYFAVKPDIRLELMLDRPSLAVMAARCIEKLKAVIDELKPDCLVVQGDTTTCASMALAAFYSQLPVVHVEAGLRTGDMTAPWPEEFNRRVAGLAATVHCASTQSAARNLLAEGIDAAKVHVTGNTVVDALEWTLAKEGIVAGVSKNDHAIVRQPTVVITAHRRENFGEGMESICRALLELSSRFQDHRFVFVTHPNPQAGPVVRSILSGRSSIEVAPAMDYPAFVRLLAGARLIISDSGGIQEEAPTLRVPLLITRESTERPEAVECGAARLVGTDCDLIVHTAAEILGDSNVRSAMTRVTNPFGDGNAAARIVEVMQREFVGQPLHGSFSLCEK